MLTSVYVVFPCTDRSKCGGEISPVLNFGWTWESMAEYTLESTKKTLSASRLAAILSKACDELYMQLPGDDTTVAVARIIDKKIVHIVTGPPRTKDDDERLMEEFMSGEAQRIVCGGTSANIVSRVLEREIKTSLNYIDPDIPPTAHIDGFRLVTEGVLTLNRAVSLLKRYMEEDIDEEFFEELDKENGGSQLAKVLIEECTSLKLFVGKAINVAHQNPNLPFDLSIRMHLIEQVRDYMIKMGKEVVIQYY